MKGIGQVWTNPILVDDTCTILAGHGRLEAAKRLGMIKVPTITVAGLTEVEKRAVVISDNRLPEQAVWDFDLLREHFRNLISVNFEVELTGFSTGEIDLLMDGNQLPSGCDPADDVACLAAEGARNLKARRFMGVGPPSPALRQCASRPYLRTAP